MKCIECDFDPLTGERLGDCDWCNNTGQVSFGQWLRQMWRILRIFWKGD